jgi:hypothetical protein
MYRKDAAERFAAGEDVFCVFIPISSPIYRCAQQSNWVVRFWDIVRMSIPVLYEYYVRVATSPDTPSSAILATARFESALIYGEDDGVT